MSSALVKALGEAQFQLQEARARALELEAENEALRSKTDNTKKLRPFEVRQLRAMWNAGHATQRELADYFQLNTGTVSRIVNGVYYKDVA